MVEGIYVSEKARRLPVGVASARIVAGQGIEGDRYFLGKGSFSHWRGTGRALTLVEADALEDVGLGFAEARRNLVVRGVDLNALVGVRFRVGDVECQGRRLCEPCRHLEKLEGDGLMRALAGRGGLRADVLSDGTIAVGDVVVAIGAPSPAIPDS
jgi:MOSC domain-containing protein YiiM